MRCNRSSCMASMPDLDRVSAASSKKRGPGAGRAPVTGPLPSPGGAERRKAESQYLVARVGGVDLRAGEMLFDEVPCKGANELRVALGLGTRERPVGPTGLEHRLERIGQRGAYGRELGREFLLQRDRPREHGARALAATRFERGRKEFVDPGDETLSRRRRGVEAPLEEGSVPLHL